MSNCFSAFVKILREGAEVPTKAKPGDAGFDLKAMKVETLPCGAIRVYTGVAITPPSGFYFEMVPRSSVYKKGLVLANSIGIIDAGYIGEVMAHFYRVAVTDDSFIIEGERVLQLVLRPLPYCKFEQVDELPASERGDGGFGSTGK